MIGPVESAENECYWWLSKLNFSKLKTNVKSEISICRTKLNRKFGTLDVT